MTKNEASRTGNDAGRTAIDALTEAAAAYALLGRKAIEAHFPQVIRPDLPSGCIGSAPAARYRNGGVQGAKPSLDAAEADDRGRPRRRGGALAAGAQNGAGRSRLDADANGGGPCPATGKRLRIVVTPLAVEKKYDNDRSK